MLNISLLSLHHPSTCTIPEVTGNVQLITLSILQPFELGILADVDEDVEVFPPADVNWNMIRMSLLAFPLKEVLLESSPKDQSPSSTHILPGILVVCGAFKHPSALPPSSWRSPHRHKGSVNLSPPDILSQPAGALSSQSNNLRELCQVFLSPRTK